MNKILVQETDRDVLELLSLVLNQGGYNVMATIGSENILNSYIQISAITIPSLQTKTNLCLLYAANVGKVRFGMI